ncbi:hypothetical protein O9G_001830 [Rozella allomycis CSF55]|uniref:Uncharacterized protein n=1 Tax=Rozella allomycis (strain CSF55) TaxID=988480 RepID=A0A075AZU3_ROZAC|nr:hypothetical protein O9G_001830 [Rozella allomycis CSF55]|eukprot:EPZ34217.1 hypothetical protein O9G_001830 [Rozella allomycis CSF55]
MKIDYSFLTVDNAHYLQDSFQNLTEAGKKTFFKRCGKVQAEHTGKIKDEINKFNASRFIEGFEILEFTYGKVIISKDHEQYDVKVLDKAEKDEIPYSQHDCMRKLNKRLLKFLSGLSEINTDKISQFCTDFMATLHIKDIYF